MKKKSMFLLAAIVTMALISVSNVFSVIDSGEVGYYLNRGTSYLINKDYDLALGDFNTLIRLDPNFAQGYNGRGQVYLKRGSFEQALTDFERAIKINPTYGEAIHNRDVCIAERERQLTPGEDYSRYSSAYPDHTGIENGFPLMTSNPLATSLTNSIYGAAQLQQQQQGRVNVRTPITQYNVQGATVATQVPGATIYSTPGAHISQSVTTTPGSSSQRVVVRTVTQTSSTQQGNTYTGAPGSSLNVIPGNSFYQGDTVPGGNTGNVASSHTFNQGKISGVSKNSDGTTYYEYPYNYEPYSTEFYYAENYPVEIFDPTYSRSVPMDDRASSGNPFIDNYSIKHQEFNKVTQPGYPKTYAQVTNKEFILNSGGKLDPGMVSVPGPVGTATNSIVKPLGVYTQAVKADQGLISPYITHSSESVLGGLRISGGNSNSSAAVACNDRGVLLAQNGDFRGAIESFDEALRINPYYQLAQTNRSIVITQIR